MIRAIVSDFSKVLLFPKDTNYQGSLNALHKEFSGQPNYQFFDHFVLNIELLEFYQTQHQLRKICMFTSDVIQDAPELQPFLKPVFDSVFSASKMGVTKKESIAYTQIATLLSLTPQEIIYVDDAPENIQAAREAQFITVQYQSNQQLFQELGKILTR